MQFKFIENELKYDGSQLSSHFAYKNQQIAGDSIIGFIGPVDVKITEMVDIEDVLLKDTISSNKMLNFIIEVFDDNLIAAIFMQRLLMSIIQDEINSLSGGLTVQRDGDDLFYRNRKLSVSIATKSPISLLIHSALNIVSTGTPIKVSCLEELMINPIDLANSIMKRFSKEFDEVQFARVKVNWVI